MSAPGSASGPSAAGALSSELDVQRDGPQRAAVSRLKFPSEKSIAAGGTDQPGVEEVRFTSAGTLRDRITPDRFTRIAGQSRTGGLLETGPTWAPGGTAEEELWEAHTGTPGLPW